ncbi:MAG: hypothetical protein IJD54_04550 [Clostridia bacterium]|nr:hypothetical protein [Clostridia bacterium]
MEFSSAKWIWAKKEAVKDDYAEFFAEFDCQKAETVTLNLSCDSVYAVYLNGEICAFSQCSDYPYYKYFDSIDLSDKVKEKNSLKIIVWYWGQDSQIYIKDTAGLIFEVKSQEKILVQSSDKTSSRTDFGYKSGYCKIITSQLGFSFLFDNTKNALPYESSRIVDKPYRFNKRPIGQMQLTERVPIELKKTEYGYLVDMGREVAGYVDLDFISSCEQKILFAYGEHIVDGKVRYIIDQRDFSFEFIAKQGANLFHNHLRRIAGRYIEVHCEKELQINYVGVRAAYYPVTLKKNKFKDELDRKIYDVSVETLRLCMHEHYEDCPWREQALYCMDSRNQMLAGYYAYNGFDYQRYNLVLISKGLRKDGLLTICYPSGLDLPIPSFSLAYFLQVYEYVQYSGDKGILDEIGNTLHTVMNTFKAAIDKTGLIPRFPQPFWNFYEWNEGGNRGCVPKGEENNKQYDLNLNCMFVFVARKYDELFGFNNDYTDHLNAIRKTFYLEDRGVYKLSTDDQLCSQLGNSLAILAGLEVAGLKAKIVEDKSLVEATLSMRAFLYDALLLGGDEYKEFVLKDIRERYKKMLDCGATSFWETEKGEADFDGAGSLCHGWSAMPIYYFNKLIK